MIEKEAFNFVSLHGWRVFNTLNVIKDTIFLILSVKKIVFSFHFFELWFCIDETYKTLADLFFFRLSDNLLGCYPFSSNAFHNEQFGAHIHKILLVLHLTKRKKKFNFAKANQNKKVNRKREAQAHEMVSKTKSEP